MSPFAGETLWPGIWTLRGDTVALDSVPLSWDVGVYCNLDHNVRTVVGWGTL